MPKAAAPSHPSRDLTVHVRPLASPPRRLRATSKAPTATRVLAAGMDIDTCDGYWQGAPEMRSVGWILGQEVYASYQDPTETGCVNPYPFTITDVFWAVVVDYDISLALQPVIASNAGTPECPYPGILLCLGEASTIDLPAGAWLVQLPLNMSCSVNETFFACVYLPDVVPSYTADLIFDADTLNPAACRSYTDWGEGWQDLSVAFPNMVLFSMGETTAPVCACRCHGDPQCDGLASVADVVQCVNVAFRGSTPIADSLVQCPYPTTDLNCDGNTTLSDVVLMVNVAFRGGSASANITNPCP
ncbi:MAG: hypothetical protein AB1792_00260 [Candidatus Zixiibacteriota bacterium]